MMTRTRTRVFFFLFVPPLARDAVGPPGMLFLGKILQPGVLSFFFFPLHFFRFVSRLSFLLGPARLCLVLQNQAVTRPAVGWVISYPSSSSHVWEVHEFAETSVRQAKGYTSGLSLCFITRFSSGTPLSSHNRSWRLGESHVALELLDVSPTLSHYSPLSAPPPPLPGGLGYEAGEDLRGRLLS